METSHLNISLINYTVHIAHRSVKTHLNVTQLEKDASRLLDLDIAHLGISHINDTDQNAHKSVHKYLKGSDFNAHKSRHIVTKQLYVKQLVDH